MPTILQSSIAKLKAEPLVAGGALVTLALGIAQAAQGHPSALALASVAAPLVIGFLARFTTVPWSKLKPIADDAAALAGQVAPSSKAWAVMLQTALDAAAAQSAATGFPVPIAQSPAAPLSVQLAPTQADSGQASPTPPASLDHLALALGWQTPEASA